MQKKILIAAAICFVSILLMANFLGIVSEHEYSEPNYEGMVKLGLAPSTESRQPTDKDVFTNLIIKDGDTTYALFESRDLSKLDFGKTFVVRVE